ncbi:MAG TPA: FecR domain-containing protein, partial [Polyangia bacterium]|nr:FecR domain-containing protein [Polyangia bacterium]
AMILSGTLAVHRFRKTPAAPLATSAPATPPAETGATVQLSDGSTATPLDDESQIDVLEDGVDRVRLSLARGRGHFQVTPRPQRTLTVRAGDVTVTVVGTVFTVERVADRVGVAVQRGAVRVDWKSGSTRVVAGQSGWFPPLVTAADEQPEPSRAAHRVRSAGKVLPGAAHDAGGGAAAELLVAADRARLSAHPEEGAALLQKLLREYPNDARAPLAAFTLGRLLLMELGRPAEAAAAFAEVRRIAPAGPFAEDALAREVEALSKAGLVADARARAREYQERYPNGRRIETVRASGGIQ